MAAKKRKTVSKKKAHRAGELRYLLAFEYLLEALYGNEFANLDRDHASRMAAAIERSQPFQGDAQVHRIISLFLSRALERASSVRARLTESGETKQ